MSQSRRTFLQTAAMAIGATGASAAVADRFQGPPQAGPLSDPAQPAGPALPPVPASEIQGPKMRFGGVEISRLVAGCNPFYGRPAQDLIPSGRN